MSTKKVNKKARRRMAMYYFALIAVIVGLFLTLPNYIVLIIDKYDEKAKLENKLSDLKDEEDNLEREVNQLNDTTYIAKIARQKYLFSKDGEIIVKVDDKKNIEKEKTETVSKINIDSEVIVYGISGVICSLILLKLFKRKKKSRHK